MRFGRRRSQSVPTLEALALGQDDTLRLIARTVLNLQARMANTEADVRPLVGRLDELEGRDNSTSGSRRGEIFAVINHRLGGQEAAVAVINQRLQGLEAAVNGKP